MVQKIYYVAKLTDVRGKVLTLESVNANQPTLSGELNSGFFRFDMAEERAKELNREDSDYSYVVIVTGIGK